MIAELIPPALAVALSPLTIIPAILVLFSPRPKAAGIAFLAAWFVGIALVAGVFAASAEWIDLAGDSPLWMAWLRILLGALLIVLGVRKWFSRAKVKRLPGWMQSISSAGPLAAARTGLVVAVVNPKVLAFSAAAGLTIGAAQPSVAATIGAVVVYSVIASLSVGVPVLASIVFGARLDPALRALNRWLEANNAVIMALLFVVIGALVLVKGIGAL